jgi:tRNA wybutosine-synthesizing protein 4
MNSPDDLVRKTCTDAVTSKACMVGKGYFEDDFVEVFSHRASGGRAQRRAPLINRGYYSRTAAIDVAMAQFLAASGGRGQCVVLGAGLDTSFFRIQSSPARAAELHAYFELDFLAIAATKKSVIEGDAALLALVRGESVDGAPAAAAAAAVAAITTTTDTAPGELHGPKYHLLPADLRDLPAVEASLCRAGWDATLPTLFVSECVLIYMEVAEADAVVAWAASRCARAAFVIYEQLHPSDPFGRTMVVNLKRRGCPLRTIEAYPDEAALRQRFLSRGWGRVRLADMNEVYTTHLPACIGAERIRAIEKLELFDEFEEWHLIQRHYFIALAINDDAEEGAADSLAAGIEFMRPTEQAGARV